MIPSSSPSFASKTRYEPPSAIFAKLLIESLGLLTDLAMTSNSAEASKTRRLSSSRICPLYLRERELSNVRKPDHFNSQPSSRSVVVIGMVVDPVVGCERR